MLTAKELAIRLTGIGASEIGAVAGISPYKTAQHVWATKLGLLQDEAGVAAEWGNRLERVIAEKYADVTGLPIRKATMRRHPKEHFVLATPDFYVGKGRGSYLLECKAPGIQQYDRWGREGSDEVPPEYAAQATWQMLASDKRDRCDIAALFGGRDFRIYTVGWDADFAAALLEAGREFWGYVERKEEPPPSEDPELRLDYLSKRWRKHKDEAGFIETASPEVIAAVEELRAARMVRDESKLAVAAAEAKLKALIGEAPGLRWGPDKDQKIEWKNNRDSLKTDFKAVVAALRIKAPSVVSAIEAKHTETKAGARVFRVPRSWGKDDE